MIYYNNESIIGKVAYYINKENIIDTLQFNDIMEIDYDCNPFTNKKQEIFETLEDDQIDLNVNCMNVYFNINYTINRQRFYERLISMNFICKYKPESYSGIKIVYKIPLYKTKCKSSGICPCTSKCTCINITFLVFQSGNVIATGFKNLEQVDEITQEFYKICELVKKDIKRRLFIQ